MMTTLEDATEIELMTAWLSRRTGDKQLTRLGRVETRHVCLYASQQLSQLRTEMLRPEMTSRHTILELRDIIADLEGLIGYLEGAKGAFSALRDRGEG